MAAGAVAGIEGGASIGVAGVGTGVGAGVVGAGAGVGVDAAVARASTIACFSVTVSDDRLPIPPMPELMEESSLVRVIPFLVEVARAP